MDLREAYKVMQDSCGIGVGDTVKVLRKAEDYSLGWSTCWTEGMNRFIGNRYVVNKEHENGISLDSYWFPWFVLELIEKKKVIVKEMTVAEISKELGYEVKVVKEGS